MHLYQYLPGTFKATNTSNAQIKTKNGSVDYTASTARSSKSSSVDRTLKASNLSSRSKIFEAQTRSYNTSPRKQRPPVGFDRYNHDRYQPPKRKIQSNTSPYPSVVGRGCSQDTASVISEVTNATTLTCPKVGPGYSDTISVNSDLTIPTIAPGTNVPEEELQDMDEWHAARAELDTPGRRRTGRQRPTNGNSSLSCILEDEVGRKVTFDKSGRYSPKDVESRLELLHQMSMKDATVKEEQQLRSSSTSRSGRSSTSERSWKEDKSPTRTPLDSMEEVVWTTLLHLEEESVCDNDNESVASSILKERKSGRQMHRIGHDSVSSDISEGTGIFKTKGRRRGTLSCADRSQAQSFSFVW